MNVTTTEVTLRQHVAGHYEKTRNGGQKWKYNRGYGARARIYVWPKGESVLENLDNRRHRPVQLYKKQVMAMLQEKPEWKDIKCRWSQKAGCSCGCSPGFIASRVLYDETDKPVDVSLTVQFEA